MQINSQEIVGLIAPVMAFLLAVTFILIGSSRDSDRYSAILGFAFVLIAAGLFVAFAFAEAYPVGHDLAAVTLCTLAFFPVAKSLLMRHDLEPPWAIFCLITGVWLVVAYYLIFAQNMQHMTYTIGSFTVAILIILLLARLHQSQSTKFIDQLIFALLAIIAVQMITGPFFTLSEAGVSETFTPHAASQWSVSHLIVGLSISALGLALLAACVLDVVADFKNEARTDLMTGLVNRHGFDTEADICIGKAIKSKQPVSFILCDIDHFKSVNDQFGHAAGDLAIKSTCDVLSTIVGDRCLVGRLGGEEFGILMPNANLRMARLLAESARTGIELKKLPKPLDVHVLTASFGVACLENGEAFCGLFARADAALYRAKRNGRNCVMIDGQLSSTCNIDRAMSA